MLWLSGKYPVKLRRMMMKKQILLIMVVLLLVLSTLACSISINDFGFNTARGSGVLVTEERPVSGFQRLELSGIGTLVIEVGSEEALVIEAEDNLLEYIETTVQGNTLEIGIRERINLQPSKPIRYNLTVKSLDTISVSGLGSVEAPALEATRFTVDISGGGDVNLEGLQAEQLEVNISGLGSLDIASGLVTEQTVELSGSGDYNGRNLESRTAVVMISGLGSATISASQDLQVEISGAGSVRYAGDPSVSSEISGLGSIEKIDE
jgi:hypothetical protein